MCVQSHYYRLRRVEPYRRISEVVRRSSWAIEVLVLCLNNNSNNINSMYIYIQQMIHDCACGDLAVQLLSAEDWAF